MATRGDPTGVVIFFGILAAIVSFFMVGSAFKKNRSVRDETKKLQQDIIKRQGDVAQKQKEIVVSQAELTRRHHTLLELRASFEKDFITGRRWLAQFVSEADKVADEQLSNYLATKKRPAISAAEVVKQVKLEKRQILLQAKLLQYQVATYKEYFPILEEYEEAILNERIDFSDTEDAGDALDQVDRVILFVSKEEYERLSSVERNQLALDRYTSRNKTKWEIGRFYERYLGYRYETDKWAVDYIGALKGFEDLGRDLVCRKDGKIHVVQAKCWSTDKIIHERHVFQLFGTALAYEIENSLLPGIVKPVFVATTGLSDVALQAAERLGVTVRREPLELNYPMIKCNINQGNKIYHLPFDQQYDRTKILNDGEFYANTVAEAERKGFRRAKRHFQTKNAS